MKMYPKYNWLYLIIIISYLVKHTGRDRIILTTSCSKRCCRSESAT